MPTTPTDTVRRPPAPFLTMTGSTLIAAAPRPPRRRLRDGRLGAYVRLFEAPGAGAFWASGVLARLPMGMFGVASVVMIAQTRGSYALAGAVSATGLAAAALLAPLVARLVDRHGQARVAVPAVLLAVLGHLLLVLAVWTGAPAWTLFACAATASTAPNTGGMARARWAHLYRGENPERVRARHTANSLEQATDELCFMLGPVVAIAVCLGLFPEAGTLLATVLLGGGTLLFAAQRRTEPPVAARQTGGRAPIAVAGMPALLCVFLCTGAVFGSMEVVTVAHADALGHAAWAGPILALQAAGSCAAGLAFGLLRPRGGLRRRFTGCVALMAVLMTLPLLAAWAGGLALLAPALLVAGMATAPTMVTAMSLVQRLVPAARINEGMTIAVTALLGGIAAGAALGGQAAEHLGAHWPYALPAAAAAAAAAVASWGPAPRPPDLKLP
ncbi:MFS transporter, partial [Streptomyces sp. OF3]